jgi:subtilisin
MKKTAIAILILTLLLTSLMASSFTFAQPEQETRVIIGFKDKSDTTMARSHGWKIHQEYQTVSAVACSLPKHELEALKKDPKVVYVEEDVPVYAVVDLADSWGVQKIGAAAVHNTGNMGNDNIGGIRVAVIDTGINYFHEDLDANYVGGYDFVNNDADPMDDNGHGTHCAGIIAAEYNNFAVVGVAPLAKLYALKVLNSKGSGYTSDIIKAIEWACANDIQVISMSLGSSVGSTALQTACYDAFYNHKIVVVAAAGNSGQARTGSSILYPARYDGVIAVGATDQNNVRATFSSTGPELDIMAPGVNILSDYIDVSPNDGRNIDVVTMSGTSMACPHVAGTAALVLNSQEKAWLPYGFTDGDGIWTSTEVTKVLISTADDLGTTGKDSLYGNGIVDADQAALTPPEPPVIYQRDYSPAATTTTRGTTTGSYTLLSANDDHDLAVKSAKVGTSQTIDWYSTTTIDVTPSTVNSLTITYDGSYTSSKSQTLYLYNFATNQWETISTKTIGTGDTTITYTTNTPTKYISTNGEIQLRTYATQRTSTSFTCNADFTQMSIKYTA